MGGGGGEERIEGGERRIGLLRYAKQAPKAAVNETRGRRGGVWRGGRKGECEELGSGIIKQLRSRLIPEPA